MREVVEEDIERLRIVRALALGGLSANELKPPRGITLLEGKVDEEERVTVAQCGRSLICGRACSPGP